MKFYFIGDLKIFGCLFFKCVNNGCLLFLFIDILVNIGNVILNFLWLIFKIFLLEFGCWLLKLLFGKFNIINLWSLYFWNKVFSFFNCLLYIYFVVVLIIKIILFLNVFNL